VLAAFLSRTGRYGVNSLIMLAAFLGIIVVANFISFSNNVRMDVTATNQFSLANSTRNLLSDLDQPVHAIAFYPEDYSQDQAILTRRIKVSEMLREFSARSNRFTYEFVDPDLKPEVAREKGLTAYESIIVESLNTGKLDAVRATDPLYSQLEQDLYTSMLVVTGQGQKKIYFLSGHGERSIDGQSAASYSLIRSGLEGDNYQVETLPWNLAEADVAVPDDAALLVVAGPTGELPEGHAQELNRYLLGKKADGTNRLEGGRVMFLVEPDITESFREFLTSWGVVVGTSYILDPGRSVAGQPHTLQLQVNQGGPPEIVAPRSRQLDVVYMPGAAPLVPINDGQRQPIPLLGTSTGAYLVDSINQLEPITEGENVSPQGRFFPAVYVGGASRPVGAPPPTAQPPDYEISGLMVFGDADFLANGTTENTFVNRGSGANLFYNSANFLLGDYALASIRDRAFVFRELNLDRNEFNFVRFTSWLLLPGLMGLLAGLVWYVRR
jgi:hypothetical protein